MGAFYAYSHRHHPTAAAIGESVARARTLDRFGVTRSHWGCACEDAPVVVKSSVSLREDQHAFAKALVDAGRFSSVSAVLKQGLDLLQQQDADIQADRAALQTLLQQRANGPFISADQLRARLASQF